jgi:hypothetical protein
MQTLVTFSDGALRALVNDPTLTAGRARGCPAGLNRLPGRFEFLIHRAGADMPRRAGDEPRVVVLPEHRPDLLLRGLDDAAFFAPPGTPSAVVALGVGPAAGRLAGVCRVGNVLRTLDRVRIAGPGLAAVDLVRQAADPPDSRPALPWPEEEVLSRTIGALGEATWRRLRGLHVALIGCGRSGSVLATGLRRLGVRKLTLLDHDRLEPHNLGEMDAVGVADVGRPKAEALADALAEPCRGAAATAVRPGWGLTAVIGSVLSLGGLVALKPVDVFVCCADSPAARLATGLLAALYLKPLLDVGTGVLDGPGPDGRRLGADVRLVLPGRCLLCLGGVPDLATARRALRDGPAENASRDWRRQRRGSVRSLNGVAVHLGLRLLEDLAAGRRTTSTWLHLETDATGLPALEHRQPPPKPGCRACALSGTGDAGVRGLRDLIENQ